MKFKEITNREQLIKKLKNELGKDLPVLSTGNQYRYIKHLLNYHPRNENSKKVIVRYSIPANVSGINEIIRYI